MRQIMRQIVRLSPRCTRRRAAQTAISALCLITASGALHATDPDFDAATGYRIQRYRSPVPDSAPGAIRIAAPDVSEIVSVRNALLIDVMPSEGGIIDPATGEWRGQKPRQNIPGSVWLPDVGKGDLTAALTNYFQRYLARLTNGDMSRAIILYCQADCWMSWNAVKRASSYGYTALYWFPEGSDGWRDWDGRLTAATPMPLTPDLATHDPNTTPPPTTSK